MSRPRTQSHSRFARLAVLVVLALAATYASSSAQTHQRGFVPPDDWEEQLAAHRVVLPMDKVPLPSFYDWRDFGGVTPPKDQADCGSCWAFAATGEMEAKIKIYYGVSLNLSEQQVVSCNPYGAGCDGGWAGAAYYVFMHYGGVLENCMPYQASDNVACRQDQYLKFTDMDTWVSISNNLDQIKTAVMENGPVCTSVDANQAWEGYSGGIIDVPGNGTNHLVLIVGWDDRMGDGGAWIVKNSWGAGWGDAGYCYVAYGACNIGVGVTSLTYSPPPVEVTVASPSGTEEYYGDDTLEITWQTSNESVAAVDIYYGTVGACQDEVIAENVPNTGSYLWQIPNLTTDRGTVLIFPSEGTQRGFGFCEGEFSVIGHQTRYVSSAGSNTPPYDTPARAAHSLQAAVLAGAGRDTVYVAGGEYLEDRVAIGSQAHLMGGWSPDFTMHDPAAYPTRLRGVSGTLSFNANARDYCGVSYVTFHDCQGWSMADPVAGRHGAAIVVMGSSPVIEHCVFEDNRAHPTADPGWGGAIMAHLGAPVVRDCIFVGNVASRGGALALSQCTGAVVARCDFLANATSDSTAAYQGAAIYVSGGSATLTDCELRGGGAGEGGGLAVAGGAVVTASELVVADNRVVSNGAGIRVTGADLSLICSEVAGNRSWTGGGGGLYATDGHLDLGNVLVVENVAVGVGGGLYAQGLTGGAVRNCVLSGNSAGTGGGAFLVSAGPYAVTDNVFVGNGGGGLMTAGAALMADYNLAHGNLGGDFMAAMGDHDRVADPLFCDPAGGDFAPTLHSPLVDSGSGSAGNDWDGGAADRGLHGGSLAAPGGPARVTGLVGTFATGTASLGWNAVEGAVAYTVYRDSAAVFEPSADNVCATVTGGALACQDSPPPGDWYYLVAATDAAGHMGGFSGRYETAGGTGTPVEPDLLPAALAVTGVSPNPFNPRTVVQFTVPQAAHVRLRVFDMRGRLVSSLVDGDLAEGRHSVSWSGTDRGGRPVATGVYLMRLEDGRAVSTRKAVLAK
ncbi:MAG: C1 family peptidase [Candidatus Krumholzibacteriia bacterium]